ncbi:MAG: 3,4-dihydroxy-2-butanone-4-phosphate synthase [Pseudomonadota bacterium]
MSEFVKAISPTAEIIEEARNGRMVILIDEEDRENEGDLVIPAQMCTPDVINFMAKYGRGLICLALTGDRLDKLGLPMMATSNSSRHETAFTVSIEAREGVTTGISAADRARTVAVAIDPNAGAQDIATPGHVFPLRAKKAGVLVRAGHTEAAVDIARLAGLNPSGVICEIMNEDGTMSRLPDLVSFAQFHNIKIGTIADLIAYRRRYDNLVQEALKKTVNSVYGGEWTLRLFTDETTGADHIAMTQGAIDDGDDVLVRMHASNPIDDLLGLTPGKEDELKTAMQIIGEKKRGVVVLLRDNAMSDGIQPEDAPDTLRQYGVGAQILSELGVKQMTLLTNSEKPNVVGLQGYDLSINGTHPITKV